MEPIASTSRGCIPIFSLPKRQKMVAAEDELATTLALSQRVSIFSSSHHHSPIEILSDDGLLMIFEKVDLADLLSSVPLVCARWRELARRARLGRHQLRLDLGIDPLSIARRAFPVEPLKQKQPQKTGGEDGQPSQDKNKNNKVDDKCSNNINNNINNKINNKINNNNNTSLSLSLTNALRMVGFSQANTACKLVRLLPNIKQLELNVDRLAVDSNLTAIFALLRYYRSGLVTFRLSARFAEANQHLGPPSGGQVDPLQALLSVDRKRGAERLLEYIHVGTAIDLLFQAVNDMDKLESLSVAVWHYCFFPNGLNSPLWILQNQLKHFHFYSYDSGLAALSNLLPLLKQEGQEQQLSLSRLEEVQLLGTAYEVDAVQRLTEELPPKMQAICTALSLGPQLSTGLQQLTGLVGRFTALTRLEVGVNGELSLAQLTTALAQLPSLSRLCLSLDGEAYVRRHQLVLPGVAACDPDRVQRHRAGLTPLKTVTALELALAFKWHLHVQALGLEAAFPGPLEVLKMAGGTGSGGSGPPCPSCVRAVYLFTQVVGEVGRRTRGGNRPGTRSYTKKLQQEQKKVISLPPGLMPPDLLLSRMVQAKESCARLALEKLLPTVNSFVLESNV